MKIFISLSGAKEKLAMFNFARSVYEKDDSYGKMTKELIDDHIKWAGSVLRKEDRVLWYIRVAKYSIINMLFSKLKHDPDIEVNEDTLHSEKAKLIKVMPWLEKDRDLGSDPRYFIGIRVNLSHFLSSDYQPIRDFKFETKSYADIKEALEELEAINKANKEEEASSIIDEYGEKLITFKDGSAWFDLKTPYCHTEGKAMDHCGNSASHRPGDTVLSYRIPKPGGKWMPWLTFVLHKDGLLGEMKSRHNQKPLKKFHPQIIALLKLPIIKGIVGGGYKPENNFELSDLEESQKEEVLRANPSLKSFTDMTVNEAAELLTEHGKTVKNNKLLIFSGDLEDLCDMFELKELESYRSYIEGDSFFESDQGYDEHLSENVIEMMKKTQGYSEWESAFVKKYRNEILGVLEDEDNERWQEATELLDSDIDACDKIIRRGLRDDSIFQVLVEEHFKSEMASAIARGTDDGANSELYKAYTDLLKSNNIEDDEGKLNVFALIKDVQEMIEEHSSQEDFLYWLKSERVSSLVKFFTHESEVRVEGNEFASFFGIEDLDVPYYGFQDFSYESAAEGFMEGVDL